MVAAGGEKYGVGWLPLTVTPRRHLIRKKILHFMVLQTLKAEGLDMRVQTALVTCCF